ncbi:peptide-binding protein [Burkholderia sp. AU30280]|uniref:SH3 domain-containing protein n=1 Tax=Burkholderia sp. AU30280 TaxID=2879628 RepID=UPI001CF20B94|nr:SH3 domain-containing protein [Burkholderia sp. AU30280]MCA8271186.1 peptide-binding protein [Burkholderia sp. AU30280]
MRNTIVRGLCVALLSLAAVPGLADAQSTGYTNSPAELFAGPAPDYPVVAQIPPGTALDVFGCLSDYTWCDVALPGVRGWIDAQLIDYPYQGGYVPLLDYGAIIGVPITGFAIAAYWDRYYRNRPWYHDRDRWAHRPEPRLGPGGVPPQPGRPQPGGAVQVTPGGPPPVHDTRPSAARGGWNGAIRTPPPGAAGNARPAGPPPAVMRPPPAPGGEVRTMPAPVHPGGGGGYGGARPQGGGNGGGSHGGGGGGSGGGGPEDFRH